MDRQLLDKLIHDAEVEAGISVDDCELPMQDYADGVLQALYELRDKHDR